MNTLKGVESGYTIGIVDQTDVDIALSHYWLEGPGAVECLLARTHNLPVNRITVEYYPNPSHPFSTHTIIVQVS